MTWNSWSDAMSNSACNLYISIGITCNAHVKPAFTVVISRKTEDVVFIVFAAWNNNSLMRKMNLNPIHDCHTIMYLIPAKSRAKSTCFVYYSSVQQIDKQHTRNQHLTQRHVARTWCIMKSNPLIVGKDNRHIIRSIIPLKPTQGVVSHEW